jgi:4-hydroxymandelate oxidase
MPDELLSVADYERAAAAVLPSGALAYYAGGAGDEITLRDNVAAWQRLAIRPRVLVGVGRRELGVTLLGRDRPHPLIVAPMAFQRLLHDEGDVAAARAAQATGSVMCLSTFGAITPGALAEAVPGCSRWFQVYVLADRGMSRELVAQAVEHGYEALVVTVDLPVVGLRERELRFPVEAPDTDGALEPRHLAEAVDPDLNWDDIARIASESPLPVLVKGVLTADDARLAGEHGAAGVVVSNHGARQLDTVPSGADALPEVVEAVGGRLEVLVDGGIRRGTDVLKALALGARAVLVGRPVAWGLAVDGAEGARRVLELLLAELDIALALAGAPRAAELDQTFVGPAPWP